MTKNLSVSQEILRTHLLTMLDAVPKAETGESPSIAKFMTLENELILALYGYEITLEKAKDNQEDWRERYIREHGQEDELE